MSPKQMADYFRAFAAYLTANREAVALEVGVTLRELVRARVVERGTSPQGTPWAPYTPQYKLRKAKDGYDVSRVDYVRTGSLWTDIQARVVSSDRDSVTIAIGPRQPLNIDKLKGRGALAPRKDGVARGLIHRPNEAEIQDAFNLWSESIIGKFLNP